MTAVRILVILAHALMVTPTLATTVTLTFDNPVGSTINDADGSGTGLTDRLPGTGSSIATDDPNLSLTTNSGKLTILSTHGNLAQDAPQGRDLDILEAAGLFFPNIGSRDIYITADFENVDVPNASDQLLIYVGLNENKVLRAGFHDGEQYTIIDNSTGIDNGIGTAVGEFDPGDNISLQLTRIAGSWSLAWTNHTTPANNSSIGPFVLPWAEDDLWIGLHAANALNPNSFTAIVDNFSVTIVPEPPAVVHFSLAAVILLGSRSCCRNLKLAVRKENAK